MTVWHKDRAVRAHDPSPEAVTTFVHSTTSQGDLDTDFASEWKSLVAPSGVTDPAQTTDPAEDNGWKAKGGVAAFPHDGGTSIAILTTMTGYDRTVSIVAMTNSEDYLPALQTSSDPSRCRSRRWRRRRPSPPRKEPVHQDVDLEAPLSAEVIAVAVRPTYPS